MRHAAFILLLAAVAFLFPPHASSVGEGSWECLWGTDCSEAGKLPTGSAYVTEDCARARAVPCYETWQAAITAVEAALPNGNRVVRGEVFDSDEDVKCCGAGDADCNGSPVGTGHTDLIGLGPPAAYGTADHMTTITGVAGGATETVHLSHCSITKLRVRQSTDAAAVGVRVADGIDVGYLGITESYITSGSGYLANGERLLSIEMGSGYVSIMDSRVFAFTVGCGADCYAIHVDIPNTGAVPPFVEIFGGDNGIYDYTQTAGGAFINVLSGRLSLRYGLAFIVGATIANNSALRIDDKDAFLEVYNTDLGGGWGDNRFITVDGAGGGSRVLIANVSTPGIYRVDSDWGSIVRPNYVGSSGHLVAVTTDADHTAQPSFVSLVDGTSSTAANDNAVDDFIAAGSSLAENLDVTVDADPGTGDYWDATLVADDVATTLTCRIVGTATNCKSTTYSDGPITGVSNQDGAGPLVKIASAAHGLSVGDTVYIADTATLDGAEAVVSVAANNFDITAPYTSHETGRWVRYPASDIIGAGQRLSVKLEHDGTVIDDTKMAINFNLAGFPR